MQVKQTVPLLLVSDIVKSQEFYCSGLGFSATRTWEQNGALQWCWLEHGEAALMLQQATAEEVASTNWGEGVTFYFICDDVDALYQAIARAGIDATQPVNAFYGMRQTFVHDPDGYELCFEQPTSDW